MSKRKTIEIVAGVIFWAVIIGTIVHFHNQANRPTASHPVPPCSTDQSPCIKLTAPEGKTYKLNDFRFGPDHCINILSLPDRTSRKICGNWHMDWIGPTTTNDIRSQKI